MIKPAKKTSNYILFRQWSRNAWAIFASLQIIVHNHCIKISSFKDSLFKQRNIHGESFLMMISQNTYYYRKEYITTLVYILVSKIIDNLFHKEETNHSATNILSIYISEHKVFVQGFFFENHKLTY